MNQLSSPRSDRLAPGDEVFWNGRWWIVKNVFCDPHTQRTCLYLTREDGTERVVFEDELMA